METQDRWTWIFAFGLPVGSILLIIKLFGKALDAFGAAHPFLSSNSSTFILMTGYCLIVGRIGYKIGQSLDGKGTFDFSPIPFIVVLVSIGFVYFLFKKSDTDSNVETVSSGGGIGYRIAEILYFSLVIYLLARYKKHFREVVVKTNPNVSEMGVYFGYFAATALFYLGYYTSSGLVRPPDPLVHFAVAGIVFPFGIAIFLSTFAGEKRQILAELERQRKEQEILAAYAAKGWASVDQIDRALKRADYGVYIGGRFHFNEQGNILTVGGPRGGKGVNLILPALLEQSLTRPDAQSWIILDPKGENCAVAADYLKWAGYKVLVINPFGIPEIEKFGNARFNVFDLFNIYTPQFASFVDMVITSLMPESQKEDDFFTPYGREVMRFHIGYMMIQDEEPKTFLTLYNWLHLTGKERDNLLLKMVGCNGLDGIVSAGASGIIGMLGDDAGKTVGGIYAAAKLGISVFGDINLRYSVGGSDFSLNTIAKEKTAVFICVNPRELNRTKEWVRIIFNSIIDNMLQGYNPERKVVVLMDEFHKLGALKVVKDNISFLPGYNVVIWPVVQSLGQLKDLYPDIWEDFVGSSRIRHYLSIQDNFTAEYLSKRMPRTIKFVGSHADGSPKEIQIPLLSQDEILGFDGIITEINGMDRPARLKKIPYWEINEHGAPNPFR